MNYDKQVQAFFTGRVWLRDEVPFPEDIINYHVQNKFLQTFHSVQHGQCRRCGNKQLTSFQCAKCEKNCTYCRACIRLGRCASCSQLITWSGPELEQQCHVHFNNSQTLTNAQNRAYEQLLQSHLSDKSRLIHAVCGAGKTEMLFPFVHQLLTLGKRVCIATPRTDVVLELTPRFQHVFSDVVVQSLYGGAEKDLQYAPLVIATTHQLLRFERAFDVIIVDEADAFPYYADEKLLFATEKAVKENGMIHYITATPSKHLLLKVDNVSKVFTRFHGYPLPKPKFTSLFNYKKQIEKGVFPVKLRNWIEKQLRDSKPFFVFFPTIELMEQVGKCCPEVYTVHASDPLRKEKVEKLRAKQIKGLFTTTILERGVTISNLQVAVVGAEHQIFTKNALIQICGRVGRDRQYPDGEIVFFHHGITTEMDDCLNEIKTYNGEIR